MADIDNTIHALTSSIDRNNYKGYDPYDTLLSPLPFGLIGKWGKIIAVQLQKRNPFNFRPLLFIPKKPNTKGMGLLLEAYSKLYQANPDQNYKKSADIIYKWLTENTTKGYSGNCWGHLFPVSNTGGSIPAGFPTVVHHSYIFRGIFEYAKTFKNDNANAFIISSGEFIEKDIPVFRFDKGICFGYYPGANSCCYNASLHAAECLAIIDKLSGNRNHQQLINDAISFVLSKQRSDGSWAYSFKNDNPQTERMQIDFHQGFIIESLWHLKKLIPNPAPEIDNAIAKGLTFYKEKQFSDQGISYYRYPKKLPVDIHNQAQGIITFSKLSSLDQKYFDFAEMIASWTIKNMFNKKTGVFSYKKYKLITNTTPMIRWSQSWMLLALANLKLIQKTK